MLGKLFKPFVQARHYDQKGGLGLGLALTDGIIRLHQGEITVDSPGEGLGCTFTIRLPLTVE